MTCVCHGWITQESSIIPRTTAKVEAKRAKVNENGAATKIACDFKSRIYRTYKETLSCHVIFVMTYLRGRKQAIPVDVQGRRSSKLC